MRDIRGPSGQAQGGSQIINVEKIKKILAGDMKELNDYSKEIGITMAQNGVTNSQLRNILDEVQKIFRRKSQERENEFNLKLKNRLELMRPKIAYLVGKQKGQVRQNLANLFQIIDIAIGKIDQSNNENFKNFIEAIVAYHRFYERREDKE